MHPNTQIESDLSGQYSKLVRIRPLRLVFTYAGAAFILAFNYNNSSRITSFMKIFLAKSAFSLSLHYYYYYVFLNVCKVNAE